MHGSDAQTMMAYDANKKSAGIAYILWFFFGTLGAHRFYLGRVGTGATMLVITVSSILLAIVFIGLLTIWISVFWALVDAFLIPSMARDFNNRLARRLSGPPRQHR